jgi:hypothetical protein
MLNKDHAQKIAKKLKARIHHGSAHDIAVVEYEGKHVADFGIRRGSRRDQGHGHIPCSVHLNLRDTLSLAQCALSYDQWIQRMKAKGLIEVDPDQETARSPVKS